MYVYRARDWIVTSEMDVVLLKLFMSYSLFTISLFHLDILSIQTVPGI